MVRPHTMCSVFGVLVFIRVPSPAARMMTAAGPLALTGLLGIGAGTRLEGSPADSRSGLPQDTARLGGSPRDGQSRAPLTAAARRAARPALLTLAVCRAITTRSRFPDPVPAGSRSRPSPG